MPDKTEATQQSEWKWFGTHGHFICGQWCRFHLTTQVGTYLISTVGEYVHPRHSAGSEVADNSWWTTHWPGEDIGAGRKYETMVFKAGKSCNRSGCFCGIPETDGHPIDFMGYNLRGEATLGHFEMCTNWSNPLCRKDVLCP